MARAGRIRSTGPMTTSPTTKRGAPAREGVARSAVLRHRRCAPAAAPSAPAPTCASSRRHGVIEIGNIYFSPRLARTRAATECMYLMMANAFELGYRRYEWKCDSCNLPSRAAATRFGFTYEGLFRQAIVNKGRNRDTSWFSIIDGDWNGGLKDCVSTLARRRQLRRERCAEAPAVRADGALRAHEELGAGEEGGQLPRQRVRGGLDFRRLLEREQRLRDQLPALGVPFPGRVAQDAAYPQSPLRHRWRRFPACRPCGQPSAGRSRARQPPRHPHRLLTSPPAGSAWNRESRRWRPRRRLTDNGFARRVGFAAAGHIGAVNRAAGAEELRQLEEHPSRCPRCRAGRSAWSIRRIRHRWGWRYEREAGRGGTRNRPGAGAVRRYSWSATLTQPRL